MASSGVSEIVTGLQTAADARERAWMVDKAKEIYARALEQEGDRNPELEMKLFDASVRSAKDISLARILSNFIKMEGLQEVFAHVAQQYYTLHGPAGPPPPTPAGYYLPREADPA